MGSKENFFIKDGYRTNPVETFNQYGKEEYWTPQRIKVSQYFQYHVYQFARGIFKKNNLKSVVDIGAGPGTKMKLFFSEISSEIAIVDQPTTQTIAQNVFPVAKYYCANLEDKAFSIGKKFDMVICSDVIEHLGDPDALLDIIKNHLKPGTGLGIVSTPDRDLRWGTHNNQSPNKQHVREWNSSELRAYLVHKGFEVVQQVNLPLRKVSSLFFSISRSPLLYKKIMKESWYANQTLVLKLGHNNLPT